MEKNLEFLKSDLATIQFAFNGQLGEASKAIEPILQAFEDADTAALPKRISKGFQKQVTTEIDQLKRAGLKRVIRITSPKLRSSQNRNSLGFTRWIDASREWRECEIAAAVLDKYIDINTGECVIELFDKAATLTLRQSRHIKSSDQRKAKAGKADVYIREHYNCPSCGAELVHIADSTSCPYCGAVIRFNFFDWQLDSFYLDLRKGSFKEAAKAAVKETAVKTAVGAFNVLGWITNLLAASLERSAASDRESRKAGYNYGLTAGLTVFFYVAALLVCSFIAMPRYLRITLVVLILLLIARGVYVLLKSSEQDRKKEKIVRYSDAYLRSCVYDEIWKDTATDKLIDFSVDEIILNSVENTETTTTIEVRATVIKKYISPERRIDIAAEDVSMRLSRARYPERKKNKGKLMEEKACPSCGANFEPDENNCCSYCGYGLKIENYIWRRTMP